MRIIRIHHPEPLSTGSTIQLTSVAAHHIRTVLRLKLQDPIQLFDGTGGQFSATITACTSKQVQVLVGAHEPIECESPLSIHLVQALLRGEKMDFIIQKATELGVAAITPVITERCNVQLSGDRLDKKIMHWQSIAIQACEQCGRNRIPTIHAPILLYDWISSNPSGVSLICTPDDANHPLPTQTKPQPFNVIIGPEGGWIPEEIKKVIDAGGYTLSLGPRILRTETAGLVAVSVLQAQWGDLKNV